jgi:GT2 family glycosyltransferase
MPNLTFKAPKEMYIRHNHYAHVEMSKGKILFNTGGHATFDTFFNSLTLDVWKKNTALEDLQLHLRGTGRFRLRLGLHRLGHSHRFFQDEIVSLSENRDSIINVSDWGKLEKGLFYFRLEALSSGSLSKGHFASCTKPEYIVRLGIVITHFNRKEFVLPAIQRIREQLLKDPLYKDHIELVVVDNSENIKPKDAKGVTLIPNKNLGGSGGFTRGLLYLKDRKDFTHCLFMDDDASCEIESIRRTFNLIRYSKGQDFAISGSLLREFRPEILHEKGGGFKNGWRPLKSGLNMTYVDHLLEAENKNEKVDYGAWWFFAFNINYPKNLAFPFFVRGDDAQFSLQNKFNITTLNGIGCWGEDFWFKEGPLLKYLSARATLVIAIVFSNASYIEILKIISHWFLTNLFSHNYASAQSIRLALSNFSCGPKFFSDNIDTTKIRKDISLFLPSEKLEPIDLDEIDFDYPLHHESVFKKILRYLTINGFLIPKIFYKKKPVLQSKHFMASFRNIFLYQRVIYYYQELNVGYIAQLDKARFFLETFKFAICVFKFTLRFSRLKFEYKKAMSNMTTEPYWRNVYKI